MRYKYLTCCVAAQGNDILEMTDNAIEITPKTFFKYVNKVDVNEEFGYGIDRGIKSIEEDYAVRFHRSKYKGKRCYYIVHSAIEYIFTE